MAPRKTAAKDGSRGAAGGAKSRNRKPAAKDASTIVRPVRPPAGPAAGTGRQAEQRHAQARALVDAAHRDAERAMAAAIHAAVQQHAQARSAVEAAHREAQEAVAAAVRGAPRRRPGDKPAGRRR